MEQKQNETVKEICPYNEYVLCIPFQKHCETCGWNPEVAEKRLAKIKNRRKGEKV